MKKVIVALFILLVALSFISATESKITIKTYPRHYVRLTLYTSSGGGTEYGEQVAGLSNRYGDLVLNLSTTASRFGIIAFVGLDENSYIYTDKFSQDYSPGEDISLRIAPESMDLPETPEEGAVVVTQPVLPSEVNETNLTENESVVSDEGKSLTSKISGYAIDGRNIIVKQKYYFIGGVFLVGIILFFTFGRKKKAFNVEPNNHSDAKFLAEAERKLKEAQEEVQKLRGGKEEKIAEAKKKLIADEQELMRLRRGEE